MGRKRSAGLRLRDGIYHIEKQFLGVSIYESCKTGNLEEAEAYLAKRIEEIRSAKLNGVRPRRIWREAATKYLEENRDSASIADDALHLKALDRYIGLKYLDEIYEETLAPFVKDRKDAGRKAKTINNALGVVRKILNLCARKWRTEGITWLASAPMIEMLPLVDAAKPYPLDQDEERKLFSRLPDHLAEACLYKVNTGGREQEVCGLQWPWEVVIPELETSVFLVPGDLVKNEEDRIHVLNDVARSVIDAKRRARPIDHLRGCESRADRACNCAYTYVFTYMGYRLTNLHTNAWDRAWKAVGLPMGKEFKKGVHNLKHTFGRRLRASGVSKENRQVLLGHKNGDITTHYSAAELQELIDAANAPLRRKSGKSPALTLIKRKAAVAAA